MATARSEDGLTYILNHKPDRDIDWLRGPSRTALRATTVAFFLLYCGALASAGAAGGYWSQPLASALSPAAAAGQVPARAVRRPKRRRRAAGPAAGPPNG